MILRPHPHFTRHVRKKNPQNHPHFTRLKIRRSADPHFTGGLICQCLYLISYKFPSYVTHLHGTIAVKRETVYPRNIDISRNYLPTAIRRCRVRSAISFHNARTTTLTSIHFKHYIADVTSIPHNEYVTKIYNLLKYASEARIV